MQLKIRDIDKIIEMACEDCTTFEAIKLQFGLNEKEGINLIRRKTKPISFKMWIAKMQERKTIHHKISEF